MKHSTKMLPAQLQEAFLFNKMKYYYCILLFLLPFISIAQQAFDEGIVVALHPSVGLTITKDEKKEFALFPEYNDSIFESAHYIKYNDSTYTFLFRKTDGSKLEKSVTKTETDKMYAQIEKIKPASTINKQPIKEETLKPEEAAIIADIEAQENEGAVVYSTDSGYHKLSKSPIIDLLFLLLKIGEGLSK
jgi:hypothetical protein